MSAILNEVMIQAQDIPEVLKQNFDDITVFKTELPSLMDSISLTIKNESIFAIMVPPNSTYDETINQLRLQAEKLSL